jgi:hypothetical protein
MYHFSDICSLIGFQGMTLLTAIPSLRGLTWMCGLCGSRASEVPRDYDGACLQMRLSYSPVAHLFLFLVQWTDCSLAGALGLLRILIYKVDQ